MRAVSDFLVAAVMAAAVFAVTPHRVAIANVVMQSTPAASPSASASPVAPAATIDTKDYAYTPETVKINAGDTVLFTNSDSVAHTIAADDGSFDSGLMRPGATWTHAFAKPGTYSYYCAYHRFMRATIVVK